MKVLIVGNGGREHALAWKLKRDDPDARIYITRGNGGTGSVAQSLPIAPTEMGALAGWAEANGIDLTVVGPETPLADGMVDTFTGRGLAIFGPTAAAARIEASKSFSKELMRRAGVPTAEFRAFRETEMEDALGHVRERGAPIVVKASGLAAGKGALVCGSVEEAEEAVRRILGERAFGAAGGEIVIESFMEGEELSVFAICDGERALTMLPAQDYKRIGEGDSGPNTGGMGAYAPVSIADEPLLERIRAEIFAPTLAELGAQGSPFRGLLYAGLMLTADGPMVVEFNARFGDPESQALLPLLASSLLEPLLAVARGETLEGRRLEWRTGAALTTVLATRGYPAGSERGLRIEIPEWVREADDVFLFHAGTERRNGSLYTSGGRVLAATAVADSLPAAAERSRAAAEAVEFEGKHFRRDIGWRDLERHAGAT